MKYLRSLCLATALTFTAIACGQIPAPKPVEYNVGLCSGQSSIGFLHIIDDGKKLAVVYYVDPNDGSVAKDPEPMVFDITEDKPLETGAVPFSGAYKDKESGKELQIRGMRRNKRLVGVAAVEGNIVFVIYGVEGSVDDLPKIKDSAFGFCIFLQNRKLSEIPAALQMFLDGGKDSSGKN